MHTTERATRHAVWWNSTYGRFEMNKLVRDAWLAGYAAAVSDMRTQPKKAAKKKGAKK